MSKALEIYQGDLDKFAAFFQAALPVTARKYLTPDRVVRTVLNAISRNDRLLQCTRPSILSAVMDCCQLGLEVGAGLGHAYLVPFKNGKLTRAQGRDVYEAIPIIGYKGYIALSQRSGLFAGPPFVNLVYEADLDDFRLDMGSGKAPYHPIDVSIPTSKRGDVVGGYCVARFRDAQDPLVEWMHVEDIKKIRSRSRAKDSGPWVSDWVMMARKTVLRRARNYWPMSAEMAAAAALDDRTDTGERLDASLVYDQDFAKQLEAFTPPDPDTSVPPEGTRSYGRNAPRETSPPPPDQEPPHDPETGEVAGDSPVAGKSAKDAKASIEKMASADLRKVLELDTRKTVITAARERLARIKEPPPTSAKPAGPVAHIPEAEAVAAIRGLALDEKNGAREHLELIVTYDTRNTVVVAAQARLREIDQPQEPPVEYGGGRKAASDVPDVPEWANYDEGDPGPAREQAEAGDQGQGRLGGKGF
jgi:recombination protein RecT